MNYTLRHALLEIESYLESELQLSVPNKLFKRDILVDYYYYPADFINFNEEEQQENNYCLKLAGYADAYDALAAFTEKANVALQPKDKLSCDNNYTFMVIECCIAPFVKAIKRLVKLETMVFICAPYIGQDDQQSFKVFFTTPTAGNLYLQLKNAKPLFADNPSEADQQYRVLFEQAVDAVYRHLFDSAPQAADSVIDAQALDTFVALAEIEDGEAFNAQWQLIQRDPQPFIEQLKSEGFCDETSQSFLYYRFLLEEHSHFAHWELDYEEIADYISARIGQNFSLDEAQDWQLDDIANKLARESDFTLLEIDTEWFDGYGLLVCKQANSAALLEAAKQLNFPINPLPSLNP